MIASTDIRQFLAALNKMADVFSDEMGESRQRTYWDILSQRLTIEEWDYACTQAMTRETFHKVPLPAVLLRYGMEARRAAEAAEKARLQHLEQQQIEAQWHEAKAARLALEASPEWQAAEAQRRAEAAVRQKEYEEWKASLPRGELIRLGMINPPNPSRWVTLSEEDLEYVPTEDPEVAKDRLRAQFRQIMDAENNPEETA